MSRPPPVPPAPRTQHGRPHAVGPQPTPAESVDELLGSLHDLGPDDQELRVRRDVVTSLLSAHGTHGARSRPGSGGHLPTGPLVLAMAAIAALVRAPDLRAALDDAAHACLTALEPGVGVSVQLGAPTGADALATTSRLTAALDGAQLGAGEGPTLEAWTGARPVCSLDQRADQRWRRLAASLPDGAGGVTAVPVRSGTGVVGTLTVYDPPGRAGPLEMVEVVELLAASLGSMLRERALLQELKDLQAQLQHALASRATIEQAKGIVMRALGVDAEHAWQHLVRMSNEENLKLRVVAERIVAGVTTRRR